MNSLIKAESICTSCRILQHQIYPRGTLELILIEFFCAGEIILYFSTLHDMTMLHTDIFNILSRYTPVATAKAPCSTTVPAGGKVLL